MEEKKIYLVVFEKEPMTALAAVPANSRAEAKEIALRMGEWEYVRVAPLSEEWAIRDSYEVAKEDLAVGLKVMLQSKWGI